MIGKLTSKSRKPIMYLSKLSGPLTLSAVSARKDWLKTLNDVRSHPLSTIEVLRKSRNGSSRRKKSSCSAAAKLRRTKPTCLSMLTSSERTASLCRCFQLAQGPTPRCSVTRMIHKQVTRFSRLSARLGFLKKRLQGCHQSRSTHKRSAKPPSNY